MDTCSSFLGLVCELILLNYPVMECKMQYNALVLYNLMIQTVFSGANWRCINNEMKWEY
jgi:hypothetical protein